VLPIASVNPSFSAKFTAHCDDIQLAGPFGDHQGGNAVADHVRQGARLRHEPIDAQDQRETGHRQRTHGGQRRSQHDEAAAGDAGGALGREQQYRQQRELLQ